jgi:hypothetical protein
MSSSEVAVITFATIWLGVLTLTVLVLVRQLGVLTVQLEALRQSSSSSYGLTPVGTSLTKATVEMLPVLEQGTHYVLALSGTCAPCRDLVLDLKGKQLPVNPLVLLSGPSDAVDGLIELLPEGVDAVRDSEAGVLFSSLQIETTPSALEVTDGLVSGNAVLRNGDDLLALMRANVDSRQVRRVSPQSSPEVSVDVSTG